MIELLPLSVGLGLAVSLLFSEIFGLAAGGMIVPGYIGLYLDQPAEVLMTLAAGFLTFAVVHTLSTVVILFGRRRTVLMILIGFIIGNLFRWGAPLVHTTGSEGAVVIGFIIPGLIAIWLDRQGVFVTLCSLVTASVVVRLLLVLFVGTELLG